MAKVDTDPMTPLAGRTQPGGTESLVAPRPDSAHTQEESIPAQIAAPSLPIGGETPLRKEDLPALLRSIRNSMKEPEARLVPPPSEEVRYVPPRPLAAKADHVLSEQQVVVRGSVFEPKKSPMRSAGESPVTLTPVLGVKAIRRSSETVLTPRGDSRNVRVRRVALTVAFALVGAGLIIVGFQHFTAAREAGRGEFAEPPSGLVPSNAPVDTASSSVAMPPPVAALPDAVTPMLTPSTAAERSPPRPVAPNRVAPPRIPFQVRPRTESSAPPPAPAPPLAPVPLPHSDAFNQERSE
jgi:hypothetical protein